MCLLLLTHIYGMTNELHIMSVNRIVLFYLFIYVNVCMGFNELTQDPDRGE